MTRDEKIARARELRAQGLRQGLTYREIGERMGIAATSVATHLTRMRAEGWDLPYRIRVKAEA